MTRRGNSIFKNFNVFIFTFLGDKLGGHPHLEGSKHRGMITSHYIICTACGIKEQTAIIPW